MNRHQRRALKAEQHQHVEAFPERLTLVPREEYERITPKPDQVWRSRKYLVQLYHEASPALPGLIRLSICRVKMQTGGRWDDGLTWEELQQIKSEVGFGDRHAVEIYPPDADVVNVANMRHLWVMPAPLAFGWTKGVNR